MSLQNGKLIEEVSTTKTTTTTTTTRTPYVVSVSKGFLATSTFLCIVFAFSAGIASRYFALKLYLRENPHTAASVLLPQSPSLPTPKLIDGKVAPHTLYTAKNFDTAASATTSSVHLQQGLGLPAANAKNEDRGNNTCRGGGVDKVCAATTNPDTSLVQPHSLENNTESSKEETTKEGEDDKEEEHLPAGQHLLVDIKNVDSTFLNSESRLAHAMVNVVNESKLTLLSYHCHSLVPTGVSCVGVLLESHVSFHTWPEEGVITLDLFTCGSGELVPVLPLIEKAFAIPQQPQQPQQQQQQQPQHPFQNEKNDEQYDEPVVVWTHKMRGFRSKENSNIWTDDLGKYLVEKSHLDMKVQVATTQTNFQRIHIFDIINPRTSTLLSYQKSLSNDGSYQSQHPEYFIPNRIVFLEGVLQSTRHGDEAYHEALVHPAMFAHVHPSKVGIIGGGEGATLREVLKHTTVQNVKMVEIDQIMVEFSREHLPDMSDCSDFVGSADWCGDDDRAEILYEDGAAWINNRFSDKRIDEPQFQEDPFDVLIMDALDPQDDIPFADLLYTNVPFLNALYNAMTEDGIIVMQLGGAPELNSPSEKIGYNAKRGILTEILAKAGFKSIHIYEEAHCGFFGPWSFLVATKSEASKKRWYRTNGEIDIDIHKKIVHTHSGKPALKYFDGATMSSYQMPSKAFESAYCRDDPIPDSCRVGKVEQKMLGQAVRNSRQNLFDVYLDRHIYENDGADKNGVLCDYLYYNENPSKLNSTLMKIPRELKAHCEHQST